MAEYHIYSGMVSSGLTLSDYDYMFISSGGMAENTTVNEMGGVIIFDSGTANSTTVNSYGGIGIYQGGTANNTTVNMLGTIVIDSEGTANNTLINSYGMMGIYAGGTANNTTCHRNGIIDAFGTVNNTTLEGGSMRISSGGKADNTINKGFMYIYSGGTADNTTINYYGSMNIYGGTANNTDISNAGEMCIFSGGTANSTTVNQGGWMYLYDGTANSTTVNSEGAMEIYSGTATNIVVKAGARLGITVAPDTYIQGTYNGSAFEMKNATINGYTINSWCGMGIASGGTANSTTVDSEGEMYVYFGGAANNTTVNSGGYIYVGDDYYHNKGGVMTCTTVNTNGNMYIYSGGIHRGSLQITSGAVVSAYAGAKIDFTVADRNTEDDYLINDLSLIQGTPTYTIPVSTDQADGTYKLAQGANNFTGTLTIGDGTVDYGTITVNGADFVHNGVTYSLDQVSGNLTLTVSGGKTAAVDGDLDGNGLADVILVHTKQGYSGAWLTTGTSSVIKWGNLGNVNSKVELVGMGNVKGTSTNGSDIIMKIGTTVAAWTTDGGKVTGYKELYTLKSNMNMLGIGDFDGDGVTDYLLRSTAGDLGYVTGDDNKWHYIKGLGKEWKISAVGDLDGNGCDDVIVRHDAGFTGAYMIDENGKITWSSLDTLKSDMSIVGTGDFNGDGVDDVLLQNKSNGWVGAWLVEDGRVDSFIGLCNNKNTIEQIADFNGDGIDDLRIRTEKGDIGVLYVNGADDTTWKYFQSVGKEWDTSFALIS